MSRRALRLCLASLWLIDGVLQVQTFMFGRGLGQMVAEAAHGSPALVAVPAGWSARFIGSHGAVVTSLIAVTELLIGLGIAWRPTVRVALAVSVAWSLAVWSAGEAFGGLLTPQPNPVSGAPGAVLLYTVLAVVLWPGRNGSPAEPDRPGGWSLRPVLWTGLWLGMALLWARLGVTSPGALPDSVARSAAGQPAWLAGLDRGLAAGLTGHGQAAAFVLAGLFALIASAPAWPSRPRRLVLALAIATAAVLWAGQGLGGVLTGTATDPNSGPLLGLLALAYWPAATTVRRPVTAPAPAAVPSPGAPRRVVLAAGRDIDAMNVLMAMAMAGMLAGRLSPVPDVLWRGLFAIAAIWFGGHTISNWLRRVSAGQHLTHLLSCGGMLVMLAAPAAGRGLADGGASGAAGGMGAMSGAALLPVLAAGFAIAMAVTTVLVTDKLAAASVAGTTAAGTTAVSTTAVSTVPPSTIPPSTVPPSTVPPSTVPPSTIPPSTVPPSTIPPSTVQPSTIPADTVAAGAVMAGIVPVATSPTAASTGGARPVARIAGGWTGLAGGRSLAWPAVHRGDGCPRLRSSCQIAMGLAMACMLIQML